MPAINQQSTPYQLNFSSNIWMSPIGGEDLTGQGSQYVSALVDPSIPFIKRIKLNLQYDFFMSSFLSNNINAESTLAFQVSAKLIKHTGEYKGTYRINIPEFDLFNESSVQTLRVRPSSGSNTVGWENLDLTTCSITRESDNQTFDIGLRPFLSSQSWFYFAPNFVSGHPSNVFGAGVSDSHIYSLKGRCYFNCLVVASFSSR